MSEFDLEEITDRAGTGAPNFTHGFNINGSDSGISVFAHTVGANEPSSPSNGDTWWDTDNDVYKVYINNEWKDWLGTTPAPVSYGSRAVIYNSASGSSGNHSNTIDYFSIATTGNSSSFGTMLGTTVNGGGANDVSCSNGSRIIYGAFYNSTSSTPVNGIEYVTASTLGNSTAMGTFTHRSGIGGAGSGGKGYYAAGDGDVPGNDIEVVDIANGGNATDSGYDIGNHQDGGTHANSSRWLIAGGTSVSSTYITTITYFAVPVVANSSTFGNLTQGRSNPSGTGNETRAIFGGGFYYTGNSSQPIDDRVQNVIDYVTIDTTGNATDFGDLSVRRTNPGSTTNWTRAVYIAGFAGSSGRVNTMDYVTIDTTGNATDFGDMRTAGSNASTASGT